MLSQLFVAGGMNQTADRPLLWSSDKSEVQFSKCDKGTYSLENVSTWQ